MPCRDYDQRIVEVDRPSTVEMLCEAARKMDTAGLPMSPKLKAWYAAHIKEDELRIAAENEKLTKEAKRRKILSKLSVEEKKLLGLYN